MTVAAFAHSPKEIFHIDGYLFEMPIPPGLSYSLILPGATSDN